MRIQKLNRSDPEKIFIAAHNDEASEAIAFGEPVAFKADADNPGNDVETLASATAATATSLFAGLAQKAMAADEYGPVQVYGPCSAAVIHTERTKATNASSVASSSWAAGAVGVLDSAGNGISLGASVGQSAYLPALVLMESLSIASATQASGTDQQTVEVATTANIFVRAM